MCSGSSTASTPREAGVQSSPSRTDEGRRPSGGSVQTPLEYVRYHERSLSPWVETVFQRPAGGKEYDVVEVPPTPTGASWQKSSASGGGACVEVAQVHKHVWVRDSKNPLGPILGFTREEWVAFLVEMQRVDRHAV